MLALRLLNPGHAELEEVEIPCPAAGEAVIRVERAGVCGTDLEILRGEFPATPPVTMGHEYTGVVAAVGSDAAGLQVGQRVVSPAAWPCGHCPQCRNSRPQLCQSRRLLGSTADGAFAEFVTVPRSIVLPLPDSVDADDGQSVLAVAVCLHAIDRVTRSRARRVAVSGPGHIGLLLLQLLKHTFGAATTVLGTRDSRLELARELGAEVINVRTDDWTVRSGSFDLVFETAGTPASFTQALDLASPGATIVLLGTSKLPVTTFSTITMYEKELTLLGSRGGVGHYQNAVDAMARGEVTAKPLISHRVPLTHADEALRIAADRDVSPVRVVLEAPTF